MRTTDRTFVIASRGTTELVVTTDGAAAAAAAAGCRLTNLACQVERCLRKGGEQLLREPEVVLQHRDGGCRSAGCEVLGAHER
jgi:hypothetical protein